MNYLKNAAAIGAIALLAACGGKSDTEAAVGASSEAPAMASEPAAATEMAGMAMPVGAKMAKGSGTVTAIDKAAGTITLDHGPIAEANWPAMTMAFKAAPGIIDAAKAGDKVDFDLKLEGNAGEVTAIKKK